MARSIPPHSLKVVALQGRPVAATAPAVGDTLAWNGSEWVPTPQPSSVRNSIRAGETQNLDMTVVGLQGNPVIPGSPNIGDGLIWNGAIWQNRPVGLNGPFLSISGGAGVYLPLTGGTLSGPGALTVGDVLTVAGASSTFGVSLIDMPGGSATVQADGNGLTLQQLGDVYGQTSLLLANRDGLNGAMFSNHGLNLVDFAFQTSAGVTGTLRLDARTLPAGQFSFMLSGNTLLAIDSAGNVNFFGRAILAANAANPLDAVPLQQLSSTVAGYLPLIGGTLSGPGNLNVDGALGVAGNAGVTGVINASSDINVVGNVAIGGVVGPTTPGGTLSTPDNFSIGGSINVNGAVVIGGTGTISAVGFDGNGVRYNNVGGGSVALQWTGAVFNSYVDGAFAGPLTPGSSDVRLKSNIGSVEVDALGVINQIELKQFDFQLPPMGGAESPLVHYSVGFVSDQLEPLIPEAVIVDKEEGHFDSINLLPMVAYLVKAVQQLSAQIGTV